MSKFDRIDKVENLLTRETLLTKLPEIEQIEDEFVREETIEAMLCGCPEYYWEYPSSSTGKYHPPDERGLYGNWLHVKRVFLNFEQIARSYEERGKIDEYERDLGRSAVFLHDMFKFGFPSEQNENTVDDHDLLAGEFVRKMTDLPEEVARCCETHNGPWADGPSPETELEELVHLADMVSAPRHMTHGVYEPTEELISECNVDGFEL